jgi:hypothetical protein
MQPFNKIYYSEVYRWLNMFRAAYQAEWKLSLDNGRSPHVYINQRLQIQFGAPDDERYAARNMLSLL